MGNRLLQRTILKWISGKQDVVVCNRQKYFGTGFNGELCDDYDEP
jgi:hypothetical protein